ncbi:Uncharacterized protein FKW44_011371, partial [Caligus rogercresseyi]
MSLEHHMNSGKILPIGQLLCSSCKDRYLKLDPKPQSLESFPPVLELQQPNNNTLIFNKQQKDVKVIVQPVPRVHSLTSCKYLAGLKLNRRRKGDNDIIIKILNSFFNTLIYLT